jgi:hypothetical protein
VIRVGRLAHGPRTSVTQRQLAALFCCDLHPPVVAGRRSAAGTADPDRSRPEDGTSCAGTNISFQPLDNGRRIGRHIELGGKSAARSSHAPRERTYVHEPQLTTAAYPQRNLAAAPSTTKPACRQPSATRSDRLGRLRARKGPSARPPMARSWSSTKFDPTAERVRWPWAAYGSDRLWTGSAQHRPWRWPYSADRRHVVSAGRSYMQTTLTHACQAEVSSERPGPRSFVAYIQHTRTREPLPNRYSQ